MTPDGDAHYVEEDRLTSPESIGAVEAFVAALPELRGEWAEHLEFHDVPLPYVFFGDVREWASANLATADDATRRRFAMALNSMVRSGAGDVSNLVGVSFFEPLVMGDQRSQKTVEAIRPWLSRESLAVVSEFET
jgi:hypothetical protein